MRGKATLGRALMSDGPPRMRAGERLDVDGRDERWSKAD